MDPNIENISSSERVVRLISAVLCGYLLFVLLNTDFGVDGMGNSDTSGSSFVDWYYKVVAGGLSIATFGLMVETISGKVVFSRALATTCGVK
jgi:hypothetical protein